MPSHQTRSLSQILRSLTSKVPSLWSDNGGLLWLTPQALEIFLVLENKIGQRKKGHNFYQTSPPWEISVCVPVHEHPWVFFSFFSWWFFLVGLLYSWDTPVPSSWPFISHLPLGCGNITVVAPCPFLPKGCVNPICGGSIAQGEALPMDFCCSSIFCLELLWYSLVNLREILW